MNSRRNTARQEIMLDALREDYVPLADIHRHVEELRSEESARRLQRETIATLQSLVNDGLAETGYPINGGSDFHVEPFAETMQELQRAYVDSYEEPMEWMRSVWLRLTESGRQHILRTGQGQQVDKHEQERRAAWMASEAGRRAAAGETLWPTE